MNKQKHQNLIKSYIAFFTFCIVLILIGVFASIPIEINITINSVGEKPPLLLAFLFSTSLLALSVRMGYSAYQYPTFLFWFLRVVTPIATFVLFGIFLLVAVSAF